jgi:hypothetical protein
MMCLDFGTTGVATPKDSPERLEALRRALQTLDEEFQVKEDEPGVVYAWNADRVFVWREAGGWNESREASKRNDS